MIRVGRPRPSERASTPSRRATGRRQHARTLQRQHEAVRSRVDDSVAAVFCWLVRCVLVLLDDGGGGVVVLDCAVGRGGRSNGERKPARPSQAQLRSLKDRQEHPNETRQWRHRGECQSNVVVSWGARRVGSAWGESGDEGLRSTRGTSRRRVGGRGHTSHDESREKVTVRRSSGQGSSRRKMATGYRPMGRMNDHDRLRFAGSSLKAGLRVRRRGVFALT